MLYLIGRRGYTSGKGSLKIGFTRDYVKTDRVKSYVLPEDEDLLGTRKGGLDLEFIMNRKLKYLGVKYSRREFYEECTEVFNVFSETPEELYTWLWEHRELYVINCKCPDLIPNLYSGKDIRLDNFSLNRLDYWWYWNYTRSEKIKEYSLEEKFKAIIKSSNPEDYPKGYRDLMSEFSKKVIRFIPSRADLLELYKTRDVVRKILEKILDNNDEIPEEDMTNILKSVYKSCNIKRKVVEGEIYIYFPNTYYRKNREYIIQY